MFFAALLRWREPWYVRMLELGISSNKDVLLSLWRLVDLRSSAVPVALQTCSPSSPRGGGGGWAFETCLAKPSSISDLVASSSSGFLLCLPSLWLAVVAPRWRGPMRCLADLKEVGEDLKLQMIGFHPMWSSFGRDSNWCWATTPSLDASASSCFQPPSEVLWRTHGGSSLSPSTKWSRPPVGWGRPALKACLSRGRKRARFEFLSSVLGFVL
jgi:hypothetical protein